MRSFALSLAALLAVALFAACGGSNAPQPSAQAPGTQAPAATPTAEETDEPIEGQPTPGTALTSCELVTPADIEAAVGLDAGTVDEGELDAGGTILDPAANDCTYDGEWGRLIVSVTPTDGVNVFDAVNDSFGDEAEDLGLGDGALWFEDDDRGYFLSGPVMLRLQFSFLTEGGFDSFRDPTVALGEAFLEKL
jgi:hypothetical protein